MKTAEYWKKKLQLKPHPEGGYFAETYRAAEIVDLIDLDKKAKTRNLTTAIYFLLEGKQFSAFHRIKSDEMWHFYYGTNLIIHQIDKEGKYWRTKLSSSDEDGFLQYVVPKGVWFASEVENGNGFALVGCTVSPGFDFQDFEMPPAKELINQFPQHQSIIQKLTRH